MKLKRIQLIAILIFALLFSAVYVFSVFAIRYLDTLFIPHGSDNLNKTENIVLLSNSYYIPSYFDRGPIAGLREVIVINVSLKKPKEAVENEVAEFTIEIDAVKKIVYGDQIHQIFSNPSIPSELPPGSASFDIRAQEGILLYDDDGRLQDTISFGYISDQWIDNFVLQWTALPKTRGKFRFWINDVDVYFGLSPIFDFKNTFRGSDSSSKRELHISEDNHLIGRVSFDQVVKTPIGVTQETWDYMQLLVPIVIAMFGAIFGWLKIYRIFKRRQVK